jgi:hypothetical protein
VARNFWGAAAHFYSLIGTFGAGFVLWWFFRPVPIRESNEPSTRRRHP